MVEYARVKHSILEMMDLETPDREIAARLGLSRDTFYKLKRRILKETIGQDLAMNVAAREYMRLNRQMASLIRAMDTMWANASVGAGDPDPALINAFTNLSRRIADLVGANAAIAFTVDHGGEDEEQKAQRDHQIRMVEGLNRFYELQDRLRGDTGIGSGLTKEERDRELANMRAALPPGTELSDVDLGAREEFADESDPDIEDAVELIEAEPFTDEDWDDEGMVEVRKVNRDDKRLAERECAAGAGDQETPGRWVAGKFVSWWHDLGDPSADDFDYDMREREFAPEDLDGEIVDEA